MSKQVQPVFSNLQVKGVRCVGKAGSRLSSDRARASWHVYFTSLNPLGAKP
ncbi:MAG: hypothetical protein AB7I42_22595 [Bradyrhizobium sp.]|uniref:hypothetical protein n=1 Tax=Bradyrhizobium sp. TaxID=376 RepID=UPI003D0B7BBC